MKNYINKENEVKFYYVNIYINFLLAVLSGSMAIRRVLEGKGISYFWTACVVIALLMAIHSIIKYNKGKISK